jgi:CRP-like cAMP-binding protein
MPDHTRSCLVAKLSHYIDLSESDSSRLAALEKTERRYAPQTLIHSAAQRVNDLFVVKSGWLYSYTDMPDGRRQIVKIHHPGDVIGFADIAYESATTSLRSCTESLLCPFPKSELDQIFRLAPRVAALLFTIAVRDQVVIIDTLRATGRMSARERVSFVLLDLACRLRIIDRSMTTSFRMPLNQEEIGDTVGLTNVYVSKTLNALERDGLIARSNGQVELLDEPALAALCDFEDRYNTMDTSWFPPGD